MAETREIPKRLIIALGGNAIHPAGIRGTSEEQFQIARDTAISLLPILKLENELIITHGNGPGVGKVLMRQTLAKKEIPPMSLDICVANTQGVTAYLLVQAFENALREIGNPRHVVGLVTQVEVDADDPGFEKAYQNLSDIFIPRRMPRVSPKKWAGPCGKTQDADGAWSWLHRSPSTFVTFRW